MIEKEDKWIKPEEEKLLIGGGEAYQTARTIDILDGLRAILADYAVVEAIRHETTDKKTKK